MTGSSHDTICKAREIPSRGGATHDPLALMAPQNLGNPFPEARKRAADSFSRMSQGRSVTHVSGTDQKIVVASEGLEPPTKGL